MMRRVLSTALLALAPILTGCISHTRTVRRSQLPGVVMDATLDELVRKMNAQFSAIQTMNASVLISASTGGSHTGQVKQYDVNFGGYIFLRKPKDLRVLLQVPVLRSKALDMVSDGNTFKLIVPPKNRAIVGTEEVTEHSSNGLENLRPSVFFDSLLIQGLNGSQIVSMTQDVHIIEPENPKKNLIEEPDYELAILAPPQGQVASTLRVIHIGRTDLLPYQQDIYDSSGHIVTRAFYSNYQNYGAIPFPSKIVIQRPLDQYSLSLTITKLTLNEKLENDQFELKIPDNVPVQRVK